MESNNVLSFGDRTAVVTGGSRNIGLAIAEKLLQAGLKVAILNLNSNSSEKAREILRNYGESCDVFTCDLRNTQELSGIFEQVQKRFRSLDVLVNSAGLLETSEIEQVTEDLWDSVVDVNLKSTFFVTQKALPFLKLGEQARIINISSNAGRMGGYANGPVYAATKGGVIALTYSLARRLAVHGITVNCVAPGTIESEMSRSFGSEERNLLLERFPLKRFGHPEEVATAICYFASLESGFTTGSVLDVNGGLFTG